MLKSSLLKSIEFLLLTVLLLAFSPSSFASDFIKDGMAEYAAGNYAEASGHFAGALSTEFNNATLHYYLGSCYAHMKQKETAVREFRIAYALEPEKLVGRFAKQALELYGYDSGGPMEKRTDPLAGSGPGPLGQGVTGVGPLPGVAGGTPAISAGGPPLPGGQPNMVTDAPKMKSLLEKQAEELAILRGEQSRLAGEEAAKHGDELVRKRTNDLLDANRYTTRWGRIVQPRLSGDDSKSIDNLKKLYESQKSSYIENGARQSIEIQNTANSLREQMNEQQRAGKVHLSPNGTNLYVRTYETTPAQPPAQSPVKSSGKTSPVPSGTEK